MIERGEVHYDFVEVMACPGGCVGGGGQPIHDGEEWAFDRGKKLYCLDENADLRFSHENPDINQLYAEYFGEPNSHKAHMLLHTDHLEAMAKTGIEIRAGKKGVPHDRGAPFSHHIFSILCLCFPDVNAEAFVFFCCLWKRNARVHQNVSRIFFPVNFIGALRIQSAKPGPASGSIGTDL